ncbi:MAG: response regulator transcription factor [Verrucomicrobia bacterium]|nr:response regulator transcription factor [Verrucomicrobiota bacterium]
MSRDKILIIEDDPTMQEALRDNFEFGGYAVHVASDGRTGLNAVLAHQPDLILLDIMLPGINGFDLCRRIRSEGLTIPIIMLTAKSQESDVIRGLELGADDYVTKPFSIDVLLARAGACLRRRRQPPGTEVVFGDCRFDRAALKLFRGGREVILTPKEFRLLDYFVRNAGRVVTRQRILDGVWGEEIIVTERSVDRCVATLRTKIEPESPHGRFIKTLRDVGYRFDLP